VGLHADFGSRDLLSMVDAGPVGGTFSSTTGPGLKGSRASSGRCQVARTRNGGRCPLLRESVSDGLGARLSVTVIPADMIDPDSGRNRIR